METVAAQTCILQNPCGQLQLLSSAAAVADLHTVLEDLKTRTHGLMEQSGEIIDFTTSTFPTFFTAAKLQRLDSEHFLEPIDNSTSREENDMATTLLSHWVRLGKLMKNLDYIRTHDEIGAEPDDSAIGQMHHQLNHLQQRSYSLICQLKMALNRLGQATSTPEYEPPEWFYWCGAKVETELQRAYIVVREVKTTVTYYNRIYTDMVNRHE